MTPRHLRQRSSQTVRHSPQATPPESPIIVQPRDLPDLSDSPASASQPESRIGPQPEAEAPGQLPQQLREHR